MILDLERCDLESLVKGTEPHFSVFDNYLVKKAEKYTGGRVERFSWCLCLNDFSDSELIELYQLCKNSWN
jgi:hypothetical protein